jgi:hypothetical protein
MKNSQLIFFRSLPLSISISIKVAGEASAARFRVSDPAKVRVISVRFMISLKKETEIPGMCSCLPRTLSSRVESEDHLVSIFKSITGDKLVSKWLRVFL